VDDDPPLDVSSPRQPDQRKDTNKKVLTQLQAIFGHLLQGRVQFHIPKGLWRDFRYCNIVLDCMDALMIYGRFLDLVMYCIYIYIYIYIYMGTSPKKILLYK